MYVGFAAAGPELRKIKMGQGVAGFEVEQWSLRRLIVAGMTHGADIQLLLPCQGFNGYNIPGGLYNRIFLVKLYVRQCGAMASLAIDAVYDGAFVEAFGDR